MEDMKIFRLPHASFDAHSLDGFIRHQGIGRKLFAEACAAARETGAEKLYISSHSSKESQAAYRALGCVHAQERIPQIADEEPFDVQPEYVL